MKTGDLSADTARARPGLYYGWVLVLTLSLTETVSWGVLYYAFAVFLTPMQDDLGWSRATLTGGYSLALLISGVAALPAGRWLDRHGPRALMTAGSCAAALLVVAWAAVDSVAAYYLVWAGIGLAMAATLYEPAFVVVATWFRRGRGRALTILTFVAGFASVIFIPLAAWLVGARGWRGALLTLAAILAATTIPLHAALLRRRPEDLGLLPDGGAAAPVERPDAAPAERSVPTREALHGAPFRWLALAFCGAMLAAVAITVHLIPYLIDRGFSPRFAATATGLIGAFALPGRLIFTPLGSVLPRRLVTAAIFLLQTVAFLVLLRAESAAAVLAFVVLFGAGFGAITPARAALVADFYGPANYGSISSVLALCLTAARALAPVGAGLLVTALGSYRPVLWGLVAVSALATVAIALADGDGARAWAEPGPAPRQP